MSGCRPGSRRGSVYVLVLAVSLFVVGAAVAAAMLARERVSEENVELLVRQASLAADSSLELGWKTLEQTSGWRSRIVGGTFRNALQVGDISVQIKFEDPADGDLTNDSIGPVRITAHATVGEVTQIRSVILEPSTVDASKFVERPGSRRREALP